MRKQARALMKLAICSCYTLIQLKTMILLTYNPLNLTVKFSALLVQVNISRQSCQFLFDWFQIHTENSFSL